MIDALLQTKLYRPSLRPSLVPRPQLIARLDAGLDYKLTLVSAPAGFGKTTLVANWLQQTERPFTWVSLDEEDSHIYRFFAYAAAAVQKIEGAGNTIQGLLQSPQPAAAKSLAIAFANDCLAIPVPFIFALDDFHTVSGTAVYEAMTFLLDNMPPQMHLVVTSRTDPMFPLPRLRASGQMLELRADALRFSVAEATTFLQKVMGLTLSADDVAALEARTEGWIAGLQMAALSIQGLKIDDEITQFVSDFTGSHRYIFDYLTDEVLQKLPSETREFLLKTSILDRLSGPLCDAVTGMNDSQTRLQELDDANLFIIPLDNKRQWYRYHHLFADLLRHRLQATVPENIVTLHQRASTWYEQENAPIEAIQHALKGQDLRCAARLVERSGRVWLARSQLGLLVRWLAPLPESLIQARPNLGLLRGWAMALTNQFDKVEPALQAAEVALQAALAQPETLVELGLHQATEQAAFRGYVATCRAALARSQGDTGQAITALKQALDWFPENDLSGRSVAELYLGYAQWMNGDLPAARRAFTKAWQKSQVAGQFLTFVSAMDALGKILLQMGRLQEAGELYREALALADASARSDEGPSPGIGLAHNALAVLHYERNDLVSAEEHAIKGVDLFKPWGVTENLLDSYDILAYIKLAQGRAAEALSLAQTAVSLVQAPSIPDWLRGLVTARQARLRLMAEQMQAGQITAVVRWAEEAGLSPDDEPSYSREQEYIILARLLLAERKARSALNLLARLAQQAESGARLGRLIEILILQALSFHQIDRSDEALSALERALALAEPEGYLLTFVSEGQLMKHLLAQAVARGAALPYIRRILNSFPGSVVSKTADHQPLPEPLSERELEVLRLLPTGQTGPQIANQLYLSNNTIKTHMKNIYSKLNVNNRAAAIERSRALGLLP